MPSSYYAPDPLGEKFLVDGFGSVAHNLKTFDQMSISPSLLLDRSRDDKTPQRTTYIRNAR